MFEPESKPLGQRFEVGDIRSLSCRVLVVDDRRDMRYLAQHMLEEAGARVSHAADGREALEQVAAAEAQGDPFDVVLLDMQMPMLDGYAAARALRERGYERPIVALTANAMKSDERRCLESGCDDYLSKPLSRATLVNTVAYYASDVTLAELAERRRAYGFRVPETEGRADEGSIADGDSRRGASSSERAAAGEDRNLPARVLVVDDNRDSCTLLRLLLQNSGCEVATAGSGGEALSAVDTFKPTVAVIDIGLPDIGGDELVGALKARVDLGACRFICLSGRRESDIDWRAAGFDHFVQKPASFDSLKRLILGD